MSGYLKNICLKLRDVFFGKEKDKVKIKVKIRFLFKGRGVILYVRWS